MATPENPNRTVTDHSQATPAVRPLNRVPVLPNRPAFVRPVPADQNNGLAPQRPVVPPAAETPTGLVIRQQTTELVGLDRSPEQLPADPEAIAEFVNTVYQQILTRALIDLYKLGRLLIEVRERIESGTFQAWIKANCTFSYQSAWNYMQLAEHWNMIEPELKHAEEISLRTALRLIKRERDQETRNRNRGFSNGPQFDPGHPNPSEPSPPAENVLPHQRCLMPEFPVALPQDLASSTRIEPESSRKPAKARRGLRPSAALRKALANTISLDRDVKIYQAIEPDLASIQARLLEDKSLWRSTDDSPESVFKTHDTPLQWIVNAIQSLVPPGSWSICPECQGKSTSRADTECLTCSSMGYLILANEPKRSRSPRASGKRDARTRDA